MKKMILFVCFVAVTALAYAGNDKPVQTNELPKKAQQFIQQHFTNVEVSYAKMENELFDKNYEVVFVDGHKIEFKKNGEWKEINCGNTKVPDAIVPKAILDYVAKKHVSQSITKIDRDSRDYEVKLNNGLGLKFDLKGNFIGLD
ncbi:PepSY-like domain-containing protein [Tannerella forsythia]|uniref:Putative beta-lactamase-inhibitor-like PepSY-like domain-containing protein n=1 Tax=Tannerella forsythia TaxID=28112 RepID=A0A3P1XNH8_TANFO|nr:PepSY-like domain-containing protein [Tannerella forsythia]RRD59560.1 hypothetical protein EII40_09455 [Tannerella forsythia]